MNTTQRTTASSPQPTGYYIMERGNIINFKEQLEAAIAVARDEKKRTPSRSLSVWTNTGERVACQL